MRACVCVCTFLRNSFVSAGVSAAVSCLSSLALAKNKQMPSKFHLFLRYRGKDTSEEDGEEEEGRLLTGDAQTQDAQENNEVADIGASTHHTLFLHSNRASSI